MAETIVAIYENGVLRPVEPLDLPEQTWVQISVQPERPSDDLPPLERREALRAILQEAGLVTEKPKLPPDVRALTCDSEKGAGSAGTGPLSLPCRAGPTRP